MAYYLKIGSDSRRTLAYLKVSDARLEYRANGFDELTFRRDVAVDATPNSYGTGVELWTAESGGSCLFVGEVSDAQLLGDTDEGIVHSYTCHNLLARLETLQYTQAASAYNEASTPSIASFQEPKVVLGMSGSTRRTSGQQIADILGYAITQCGLALTVDSSVAAAGSQFPLDQRENISCWEGVVCCLRWMSDYTLWVDYSGGAATVKLTRYVDLSSQTLAAAGGVLKNLRATPRSDLVKPGVNIFYRKTFTTDGSSREQRFVRSAGSSSSASALNLYIDLEGSTRQTVSQAVTVANYPNFTSLTATDTKAWVQSKVPWIANLASWTITGITRSGSHAYSKELVGGQIASWMSAGHETEFITVNIDYEIQQNGAVVEKASTSIPIECVSTSASTKTYRRTVSYDSGESIPDGLETAIYSAWSILHWDGSLTSDIDKCGWIRPGMKINVSGSASSLASMGAVVQSSAIDLATGELSLTFGTCRGLEADSLVALYRATRGRRYAWSVHSQISSGDDSSSIDGGHFNNANASPTLTKAAERISAADSGNRTHIIDLKPSAIVFGSSGNASAQTIQPREVILPVNVNGVHKLKKFQVLCGEGYGTDEQIVLSSGASFRSVHVLVDDNGTLKAQQATVLCTAPSGDMTAIGGGTPDLTPVSPLSVTTLGSTSEGSEASLTDSWTSGALANGLDLYVVARVVYDHQSDGILYGYFRKLTFTQYGQLYSASAESRFIIDTPVNPFA